MRNLCVRQKVMAESRHRVSRVRVPEMKGTAAAAPTGTLPATVSGRKGRAILHFAALTPAGLASGQGEVDHYFCIHFDRLAIQQIWLIPPLLNGIDGGRSQHGMPADQGQT